MDRASNDFRAGTGQNVRSNLFLLGHIPFLAGQTLIMSYRYKSAPPPSHDVLHEVNFQIVLVFLSKHLFQ